MHNPIDHPIERPRVSIIQHPDGGLIPLLKQRDQLILGDTIEVSPSRHFFDLIEVRPNRLIGSYRNGPALYHRQGNGNVWHIQVAEVSNRAPAPQLWTNVTTGRQ